MNDQRSFLCCKSLIIFIIYTELWIWNTLPIFIFGDHLIQFIDLVSSYYNVSLNKIGHRSIEMLFVCLILRWNSVFICGWWILSEFVFLFYWVAYIKAPQERNRRAFMWNSRIQSLANCSYWMIQNVTRVHCCFRFTLLSTRLCVVYYLPIRALLYPKTLKISGITSNMVHNHDFNVKNTRRMAIENKLIMRKTSVEYVEIKQERKMYNRMSQIWCFSFCLLDFSVWHSMLLHLNVFGNQEMMNIMCLIMIWDKKSYAKY